MAKEPKLSKKEQEEVDKRRATRYGVGNSASDMQSTGNAIKEIKSGGKMAGQDAAMRRMKESITGKPGTKENRNQRTDVLEALKYAGLASKKRKLK